MSATLTTVEDFEVDTFGVAYTDESRKEFAKSAKFKATNTPWNANHHNSKSNVGAVMEMINSLPKGSSFDDWVDHYFDTRGGDRIWDAIAAWQDDLDCTWKFAVNSFFVYVLDFTFTGVDGENRAIQALKADRMWSGYRFRPATAHEDNELGVDIVATSGGKVSHGFQVKPQSYFGSRISDAQRKARTQINPKKYEKFVAEYPGSRVFYLNHDDLPTSAGSKVKMVAVANVEQGWR